MLCAEHTFDAKHTFYAEHTFDAEHIVPKLNGAEVKIPHKMSGS